MSRSRFALLGILTLGPRSGSELKEFIDESISHFWAESYGNLYPRLHELQAEGLVQSHTERRNGAPEAVVYTLTAAGRTEFETWMTRPFSPQRVRDELLLRVFFGGEVPATQTAEQIRKFAASQRQLLETFGSLKDRLVDQYSDERNQPYWLMTLRRGELVAEARLRWAEESLELLSQVASRSHAQAP